MFKFLRFKKKADNYRPTVLGGHSICVAADDTIFVNGVDKVVVVKKSAPKSVASASYKPAPKPKAVASRTSYDDDYVTPPSYSPPETYSGGGGSFGGGGASSSWDSPSSSSDSCSSSDSSSYSSDSSSSSCSSD